MEIWRDITEHPGYMVSNKGQIKNADGKTLKQQITKDGYLSVALSTNGIQRRYQVHRLVALAFIENHENAPEVNHKDENKQNNNADNLEWCTREYNLSYGTGRTRQNLKKYKPVEQIKDMKHIAYFDSAKSAGKITGISKQHIGDCCRNERKSAGGYQWRFV